MAGHGMAGNRAKRAVAGALTIGAGDHPSGGRNGALWRVLWGRYGFGLGQKKTAPKRNARGRGLW